MEIVLREIRELKDLIFEQSLLQKTNLTFTECARYAGVSESHLYKLTSSNRVPHYKNGKHLIFNRAEIDTWLTRNRVRTTEEIESKAATHLTV